MNIDGYIGCVYLTINKITNQQYLGKCKFDRKNNWEQYLGSGLYLKRAIKKYSKENFEKKILYLAKEEDELEKIEESFIEYFDAVFDDNFYNVKLTSRGGDTFTTHPEKKKITEKKSKSLTGKNNPMYQKPKTRKMIDSVKKSNSKKVMVDGIKYESVTDYYKKSNCNLSKSSIFAKFHDPKVENYYFIDDFGNKIEKSKSNKSSYRRGKIIVNNKIYNSIKECNELTGESKQSIKRKLIDDEYDNYKYL